MENITNRNAIWDGRIYIVFREKNIISYNNVYETEYENAEESCPSQNYTSNNRKNMGQMVPTLYHSHSGVG